MSAKAIDQFCAKYKQLEAHGGAYDWAALDRVIVGACSRMPDHVHVDEVFAKVAIINRTYRANLQLVAQDAEWKIAEGFVKGRADDIIAPLRGFSEFSGKALPALLESHEGLVKLIRQVTKTKRTTNSFVSKYLHFHFPGVVPIFDSYSYNASWALAPLPESEFAQYEQRLNGDYGCHCGALLQLVGKLQEHGVKALNVKLLDVVLYGSRPEGEITHG